MPHIDPVALNRVVERLLRPAQRKKVMKAVGYIPHAKQQQLHDAFDSGAEYIGVVAGARSGKTEALAIEAITEAGFEKISRLDDHRMIQVAAPEADLTDRIFEKCWRALVDQRIYGCSPIRQLLSQRVIEMPWHSRIEGKTTKEPASLLGKGIALSLLDEFARMKDGVFENYIQRNKIDNPGSRIAWISTPLGKLNHASKKYEAWTDEMQAGNHKFFTMGPRTGLWRSVDNPHVDHEELMNTKRMLFNAQMQEVWEREYEGKITSMSGGVFPTFNQDFHVGEPTPLTGVMDGAIDWGFSNPFATLFCQLWPDDQLVIFDEIYERGLDDDDKAKKVKAKLEQWGWRWGMGVGDPSSPGAIKTFRKNGLAMYEPRDNKEAGRLNNITDGNNAVRILFGRKDKPGILIHRRCKNLISETGALAIDPKSADEKPLKVDDHTTDALRYYVVAKLGAAIRHSLILRV